MPSHITPARRTCSVDSLQGYDDITPQMNDNRSVSTPRKSGAMSRNKGSSLKKSKKITSMDSEDGGSDQEDDDVCGESLEVVQTRLFAMLQFMIQLQTVKNYPIIPSVKNL